MPVVVAVSRGDDSHRGSRSSHPRVVRAMRIAMMVNLIHIDFAHIRSNRRFHILIHLRVVPAQVSADLFLERPEGNHHRQAEVVLVRGLHRSVL